MRSRFTPILLPLAALIASLVRWTMQGSGNRYTATHKRFYVPDPVTEWRVSSQHPVWLGLEVCAVIAAIAVGLAIGAWFIGRREAKRGQRATILRAASWLVAIVPLAVPILAFASGPGPLGGVDLLPAKAAVALEGGIDGSLALPAGTYAVVPGQGTAITAKMTAGGEMFDATFTGDIRGTWQGDPAVLTTPMRADVSVATASVNTGIDERSKHARESYLLADKYPRLTFTLGSLIAARQDGPGKLAIRVHGTVGLIGRTHEVEVTGSLKTLDAAALQHLGIAGGGDAMLFDGAFSLVIKDTALAPDAGDFDGAKIPVLVSLVLRHTSGA